MGLSDRLGDLEFPDRFGDLESALLGDLESALLGDLELPDLLGDLELRRSGDLDLFEAGDASLAFRAGERSLDLVKNNEFKAPLFVIDSLFSIKDIKNHSMVCSSIFNQLFALGFKFPEYRKEPELPRIASSWRARPSWRSTS